MLDKNDDIADRHDQVWDAYHGILGPNFMRDTQKRINWVCGMVSGTKILDIGCSSGITPILLAREGCEVAGIDSDPTAISEALQHLADEPIFIQEKVRFIEADFFAYSGFEDEKFETVIASEILEHLLRPQELIKKASELLVSGGRIVITVPFGINDFIDHKRTYYLTEPYNLLSRHFDVVHVEILGKWLGLVGSLSGSAKVAEDPKWDDAYVTALEDAVFQIERGLHDNLAAAKTNISNLTARSKEANSQIAKLKSEVAAAENKRTVVEAELKSLKDDSSKRLQKAEKTEVELKSRIEENESRFQQLQNELQRVQEESYRKLQQSEKSAEELRLKVAAQESLIKKLDVNFKGLAEREKRYKQEIEDARKKVEKAKNSISFQLGYALIHAPKSWGGLFGLPGELTRIRQEATSRRENKRELELPADIRQKESNGGRPEVLECEEKAESGLKSFLNLIGRKTRGEKSAHSFKLDFKGPLRDLRIAAVMDEFTFKSFGPECNVLQLRPEICIEQLQEFKPHLFFIESAWKGVEDLWKLKISNYSEEIDSCIQWCRKKRIAAVFWNKEDPVHFNTFLPLAKKVDCILTTDIDCIPKYKQTIGHDRVYLLPFAAQPKIHNPVETFERKDAFNFAGSYYQRYPERQRDFARLIDTVRSLKPVEIYDRNYNNPHPHYSFPDTYRAQIIGYLPVEEIDKAYKGYRYGINMNTIKQSQSMFARRVFELLASNTVVVSNFSRAMRILFGDLVICSDDANQLRKRLETLCNSEVEYRKLRLMGLRRVMQEHTYAHRLEYVLSKISAEPYAPRLPEIGIVAVAGSPQEQAWLIYNFERQSYPACELYLLQNYGEADPVEKEKVHAFTDKEEFRRTINRCLKRTPFVSLFAAHDYYGKSYLWDLVLAASYSDCKGFGKIAHYSAENGICRLLNDGNQYRPAQRLEARASLLRSDSVDAQTLGDCLNQVENAYFQLDSMLAVDEFNYCRGGSSLPLDRLTETIEDPPICNQGLSFNRDIAVLSESLEENRTCTVSDDGLLKLSADRLYEYFEKPQSARIEVGVTHNLMEIKSKLFSQKHAYIYTQKAFPREELNLVLNSEFRLDAEHNLEDCRTVFEFLDENGIKISHAINDAIGSRHALAIHPNCTSVRFGLRLQGTGTLKIKNLVFGSNGERPAVLIGCSPYLALTKQYPNYDDLYRYGFLHSRLRAYKENGLSVDVFRITKKLERAYYEFEGIDVASGDAELLNETLKTGRHKHVLVHLLDDNMWPVLERHLENIRITVWIHGAEIQAWQHRSCEFVYMTDEAIERQKKLSEKRNLLWESVLNNEHPNLHFIFISKYLKEQAESDLNIRLSEHRYSIVNNFIDEKLFKYTPKTAEDRLKILSIRPYTKRFYANDLSAAAIIELSKRPFFNELSFTLVGDGDLFDQTVEPLRGFKNIEIEKRFLNQFEISQYHQRHGIFLTPTRMDTQGVSRDEAMSSGLVPITNNVAAIPEFVDESCAILADEEDFKGLADGVEYLYSHPDAFLRMSKAASERVKKHGAEDHTIRKEIEIIRS